MFSPIFSFSFAPNFATPVTDSDTPSPEQHPLDHIPAIQTAIPDVPVTISRPVFNPESATNTHLPNPGTARANTAPTPECPAGTPEWASAHAHSTVLQQHCAFFDGDGDGVIWPLDTFRGLRALGFGLAACAAATLVTHAVFSYPTCAGALPDPLGRIWLARIHRCKHGSDSGAFDTEGRFVPQKFEDLFAKYGQKEGIHSNKLWEAVRAQRVLLDPTGWFCTAMAWLLTYMLLRPDSGGFIKKEDVRRVFDGSIFEEIVQRRARETGKDGQDVDEHNMDLEKRVGKTGGRQKED